MTELELIRHLDTDTPSDRLEIKAWLTRTDPAQAADMLVSVIRQCRPGQRSKRFRSTIYSIGIASCLSLALLVWATEADRQLSALLPLLTLPMLFFNTYPVGHPEAGQRAALLLASLDDPRAVAGLAASWVPRPESPEHRERNERTEAELTRLLTLFTRNTVSTFEIDTQAVRNLLRRVMKWWRDTSQMGTSHLSDERADMLLAIIRWLHQHGTEQDTAVLREIARLPLPTIVPGNRAAVQEAAAILALGTERKEATANVAASQPSSATQTLGRRS
jgi:hypothetical protein